MLCFVLVSVVKIRLEEEVKWFLVVFNRLSEVGMYVVVCIGGIEIKMLVDIGVIVILFLERVYDRV